MFTCLVQISCSNMIPYELQKLKGYLQPQLVTPLCIQTFNPTQPFSIREDLMYINGECRIQLQFSVLTENFDPSITRFGFAKLKKKKTPQETYLPDIHKPSYIRIPFENENIAGFTVNYTTFVEAYTPNPKRIQQISIMSPVIFNVNELKINMVSFLIFLECKPQDNLDDFAFQFGAIVENHDTTLMNKIVKHVYSQPFKIFYDPYHNLRLLHVDSNEYHMGV